MQAKKNKDILSVGGKITDKAYEKENQILAKSRAATRLTSSGANLFDATKTYVMPENPVSQNLYQKMLRRRNRIKGGLYLLEHLVKLRCSMKKIGLTRMQKRSMENDAHQVSDQPRTKHTEIHHS